MRLDARLVADRYGAEDRIAIRIAMDAARALNAALVACASRGIRIEARAMSISTFNHAIPVALVSLEDATDDRA